MKSVYGLGWCAQHSFWKKSCTCQAAQDSMVQQERVFAQAFELLAHSSALQLIQSTVLTCTGAARLHFGRVVGYQHLAELLCCAVLCAHKARTFHVPSKSRERPQCGLARSFMMPRPRRRALLLPKQAPAYCQGFRRVHIRLVDASLRNLAHLFPQAQHGAVAQVCS